MNRYTTVYSNFVVLIEIWRAYIKLETERWTIQNTPWSLHSYFLSSLTFNFSNICNYISSALTLSINMDNIYINLHFFQTFHTYILTTYWTKYQIPLYKRLSKLTVFLNLLCQIYNRKCKLNYKSINILKTFIKLKKINLFSKLQSFGLLYFFLEKIPYGFKKKKYVQQYK